MNEVWKYLTIDGIRTDWSISNFGFIKNEKGEIVDQYVNTGGYFMFTYKGGQYYVHRLVASNFIQKDLAGMHVHHVNHCPWDNRVENLEVLTPSEHARVDNALSESTVLKICEEILANKLRPKDIANKFGVSERVVRGILHKESYKNYVKDMDFSSYGFLRANASAGNRDIINEAVELYEKGYKSKEVLKYLTEKYGSDEMPIQKIYYFNTEAKKLAKNRDDEDARYKYSYLYEPLDELILEGATYEKLMEYLKKNTSLSYDDSRYLVERRISHHKKIMGKFMNK